MANETSTKATGATPEAKAEKKGSREKLPEIFADEAAATASAADRTKGPRRAFKCTLGKEVVFCVAHNEGRAGGIAFTKAGGKVEEIGAKARKTKPLGVDGVLAAVNAMPEAERAAVLEQMKKLAGAKK